MRFKEGDKVFPISKSLCGSLSESACWKEANANGQYYLVVRRILEPKEFLFKKTFYVCGVDDVYQSSGDFFAEGDLVMYESGKQLEFQF